MNILSLIDISKTNSSVTNQVTSFILFLEKKEYVNVIYEIKSSYLSKTIDIFQGIVIPKNGISRIEINMNGCDIFMNKPFFNIVESKNTLYDFDPARGFITIDSSDERWIKFPLILVALPYVNTYLRVYDDDGRLYGNNRLVGTLCNHEWMSNIVKNTKGSVTLHRQYYTGVYYDSCIKYEGLYIGDGTMYINPQHKYFKINKFQRLFRKRSLKKREILSKYLFPSIVNHIILKY